jgi:hypothetical protein
MNRRRCVLSVLGVLVTMVACTSASDDVLSIADAGGGAAGAAGTSQGGAGGAAGSVVPGCTPGDQKACACPGAGQGAQVCNNDGKSWGTCFGCGGSAGAGTGGYGGQVDGGTGGGAGVAGGGTGGAAGVAGAGGQVDGGTGGSAGAAGAGGCTGECAPGQVQDANCGNCGSKTRTCNASCAWGAFSACIGEGQCKPGDLGAACMCSTYGGSTTCCGVQVCGTGCDWSCELKAGAECDWKAGANWRCCGPNSWQFCLSSCKWQTTCASGCGCGC